MSLPKRTEDVQQPNRIHVQPTQLLQAPSGVPGAALRYCRQVLVSTAVVF
jgi:hypothetical protein